jgi:hypothetical protein
MLMDIAATWAAVAAVMPMQLLAWLCVAVFFHVSEFALAAVYMREELGWHCEFTTAHKTVYTAIIHTISCSCF